MAHFLVVTFPAQGHINPSLQFAKLLARTGARVTFATAVSAHRRMIKSPAPDSLTYASYTDGFDDGFKPTADHGHDHYMVQLKKMGRESLSDLVRTLADEGRPVTCVVYGILLAWVADMSCDFGIPSVLLWIQPATVFAIYYHYFHGYDNLFKTIDKHPVQLPKLPLLSTNDIPSALVPSDNNSFTISVVAAFRETFEALDREEKPRVLINTFDALESDVLRSINKMTLSSVGPMISSAFLDGNDPSDTCIGGDLFKNSRDYVEWLDSKPAGSVVYVSFGSTLVPSKQQMEEMLNGLLESSRPFLWVVIVAEWGGDNEFVAEFRRCVGDTGEGMVVPWCSQVEVLSHPSTGCFVTHCGWNSTAESLGMGVPMVCCPNWADQMTNAKLVEDVWKTGVRVKVNEDGVLEGGELKRCLEVVLGGERGEEMRKNASKWSGLAREAVGEGGSSYRNISGFVDEVRTGCRC